MTLSMMSKTQLHRRNLQVVLAYIFNYQPVARTQIATDLNVTKSTISTLYKELKERGLVTESGIGDPTEIGGRKPVLVSLNTRYGYTINIDLGYPSMLIMQNDLAGGVVTIKPVNTTYLPIESILKRIDQQVDYAAKTNWTTNGLQGISLAIHGRVANRQVMDSPFLDMHDIDIAAYLQDRYQVPVTIANEANLAAVYHRDFDNRDNQLNNLVLVSIQRGVNTGLLLNRHLYKGGQGRAGELGHVRENGQQLTTISSEATIISHISNAKGENQLSLAEVKKYHQHRDNTTETILTDWINQLAQTTLNLTSLYDPDEIVYKSPLMDAIPELFDRLKAITTQLSPMQETPTPLSLVAYTKYASLLGGCAMVTRKILDLEDLELNFTPVRERALV